MTTREKIESFIERGYELGNSASLDEIFGKFGQLFVDTVTLYVRGNGGWSYKAVFSLTEKNYYVTNGYTGVTKYYIYN